MTASGKRHIFYILMIPLFATGAADLNEHAGSVQEYAVGVSTLFLALIAWYSRKQMMRADIDHDTQIKLASAIDNLTASMLRVEYSVSDLAKNQSYITTRQTEMETYQKATREINDEKWRQQEKQCNEHRAHCKVCDRRQHAMPKLSLLE